MEEFSGKRKQSILRPQMPRVLSRLPYGTNTKTIDEFDYEEVPVGPRGESNYIEHEPFCWMNAAYVMATKLTDAFAQTGFCTAIRGVENGGKVEGLRVAANYVKFLAPQAYTMP